MPQSPYGLPLAQIDWFGQTAPAYLGTVGKTTVAPTTRRPGCRGHLQQLYWL